MVWHICTIALVWAAKKNLPFFRKTTCDKNIFFPMFSINKRKLFSIIFKTQRKMFFFSAIHTSIIVHMGISWWENNILRHIQLKTVVSNCFKNLSSNVTQIFIFHLMSYDQSYQTIHELQIQMDWKIIKNNDICLEYALDSKGLLFPYS